MDPLSAFALAGTVYTFIDAGITITKFAKELSDFWKSSRETTESVGHLTVTTRNLEALSSELRNTNEPHFLRSVATECATLCQELSGLLDRLRVKDKTSKSEHLSVMFSAYRRKDKISSIEKRLERLRAQMTLDLVHAMNHGQSDVKRMLDETQNDTRKLSVTHSEKFRERRAELFDLLEAYEKSRQQDQSAIISRLQEFRSEVSHERIQNQILQTLRFDGMYSREDNTSEPSEGTFRWLLNRNRHFEERYVRDARMIDKMQITRKAFLAWLLSGEGVFHICGKAGSGKSTLMKLVCTNSRTQDALTAWAGNETLLYASFFFFAPGEKEAKSLTGLYRCVLFTTLHEHRHLMEKIYPDEFLLHRQSASQLADLVQPKKLEKALQSLINVAIAGAYKMCIFIDGLDEYEGSFADYWQLADRLRGWADKSSGRVKFCVSSRPEVQFVKTFGSDNTKIMRQIHLHEFTSGDIEKHCRDQFAKPSWFKSSDMVPNYDKFVHHIVLRAQGVFLWAVLVTKVLHYETRKDGFERDLWRSLEEIPDDINGLYEKLFDSMGEMQKRKCHRILLTILTNPFQQPLNARCLNWIYDEEDLDQALLEQHGTKQSANPERQVSRVVDNLSEWTRGLVEVVTWNQAIETRKAWDGSSSITSIQDDSKSQGSGSDQDMHGNHNIGAQGRSSSCNLHDMMLQDSDIDETGGTESDDLENEDILETKDLPLFQTRVRLFHKTVKEYMLNPARFRKLESDFPDFDGVKTHATLRLLELVPSSDSHQVIWSSQVYRYGYEILGMDFGENVGSSTQFSWSICEALGSLLPTRAFCAPPVLERLFNSSFNPMNREWADYLWEEMSFPHFAAFLGHPEALERQCVLGPSQGSTEYKVPTRPQPNLLLSACLGRVIPHSHSVHTGANDCLEIVTKVLELGYSGHDYVWLTSLSEPEVHEKTTVWQLLILILIIVDPLSSLHMPNSVEQLLNVLTRLLESESQEEVLVILRCEHGFPAFSSFITVQDVVGSLLQSDSRDSLLRQLNDWPQYRMKKPPAWTQAVSEVRNNKRTEGGDLRRFDSKDYLEWGKERGQFRANHAIVVSRSAFIKGGEMVHTALPLW